MNGGVWVLLAALFVSCAGEEPRAVVALPTQDECYQRRDMTLCSEGVALVCTDGKVAAATRCGDTGLTCVDGVGCRVCTPYGISCEGNRPLRCDAQGGALEPLEECAAGLSCSPRGCRDLCADATIERSYLGCDYWPVFTSNRELDSLFAPAVVIGNGNLVTARVAISKGESISEVEIAPRSALTVELAFDPALRQAAGSSIVRQGAYHLRASVPVTVHQFNPLLFSLPKKCAANIDNPKAPDECFSFTNDASLLLPTGALAPATDGASDARVSFLAMSRATFMPSQQSGGFAGVPGFVAVVAMGERPVNVRVRTSAHTRPSFPRDLPEPLARMAPGELLELLLMPGDVLQLLSERPDGCPGTVRESVRRIGSETVRATVCEPGATFDLTGTEVSADGPIEVIGGHDCTNVPSDRFACDHLEESLTPVRTWGTSVVAVAPRAQTGASYVLRLLSGEDANVITFDPPLSPSITLARGQYVDLTLDEPVQVVGTGRILAAQYLIGQDSSEGASGDPSLSLVVPIDQYRTEYNFLSPATYSSNYASIVARAGDLVWLDDKLISSFEPVGASVFQVARVKLTSAGAHRLRCASAGGVGVMLYGVARYTSYMLPGGLDLAPLGTPGF
jgi:hypothetical protein